MATIALVGADGAGKTTISRMLVGNFPSRLKLLYMGINPDSTNVSLFTSRIHTFLRKKRRKQTNNNPRGDTRGAIWSLLSMLNRIAEEWYRQALSAWYQLRGYTVIYDRYYFFDYEYDPAQRMRFSDWFHRWLLAVFYPAPDIVIFLDAPADVLFARKAEWDLVWLENRRASFLRQGAKHKNFICIDATQPLELVYAQVAGKLTELWQSGYDLQCHNVMQ
jgi:thymidylate kinase